MRKKLNSFLNILIGSFMGVFIGRSIYTYWDYKAHPHLYAVTSLPWYAGLQLFGTVVAAVVGAAVILKIVIWFSGGV